MKTKKTLKIALLICGIILSNLTIAKNQFIGDSLISKKIEGCTDTNAINYNPYATVYLENSCIYKQDSSWVKAGCTDTSAINYNPYATVYLENSCIYKQDSSWVKAGCTDTSAINYNPYATVYLENSCIYKQDSSWVKAGCTDTNAINYNPYATVYLENSCIYKQDSSWAKAGCMDTNAINYNPYATVYLENSCIYKQDSSWVKAGCMDTNAINYNPYATVYLENSCIYKEDSSWVKAGCMDTSAINYNPYATVYLENSCIYKEDSSWAIVGCTDILSANYNQFATISDNSCQESDYVYNNTDVKIDSINTNIIETVNNCEVPYGLQIVSANISSISQNRDTLLTYWSIGILGYDKLITIPVFSFRTLEIDEYVLFKLNISCNSIRTANSNQYTFVNILSANEINSRLTNVTAIGNQNIESNKTILNRINLQGQEVDSNYKGLIIIRYTDGSTQKQFQN